MARNVTAGTTALAVQSLRRAWRERRLALLLWAIHLLLAFVATTPVASLLQTTLTHAPEGDRFLSGLSLPLLADLLRSAGPATRTLGPLLSVVAGVALLINAAAAGGAVEVLLIEDRRAVGLRFARGAGRYFGRFLRMGLVATPAALLVAGLGSLPLWIVRGALDPSAEAARFFLGIAGTLVGLAGFTLGLLALDLARVRIAREDASGSASTYFATLWRVLRRPGPVFRLWLVLALTLALCLLGYLGIQSLLPSTHTATILLLLIAQQAILAARAFYRVALWSGEAMLVEREWPRTSSFAR